MRYNVAPRYTCGSPALVDHETARHVAHDEKLAYEDIVSRGFGTDKDRETAKTLGLKGIIEFTVKEERRNRTDGFVVRDYLTGETFWRPGRGGDAEPDCALDEDHILDTTTIKFDVDHETMGVVAKIACKLCKRIARSEPIPVFFKI